MVCDWLTVQLGSRTRLLTWTDAEKAASLSHHWVPCPPQLLEDENILVGKGLAGLTRPARGQVDVVLRVVRVDVKWGVPGIPRPTCRGDAGAELFDAEPGLPAATAPGEVPGQ